MSHGPFTELKADDGKRGDSVDLRWACRLFNPDTPDSGDIHTGLSSAECRSAGTDQQPRHILSPISFFTLIAVSLLTNKKPGGAVEVKEAASAEA